MTITAEKLKAIEVLIDTTLDSETTESLTNWLLNKRNKSHSTEGTKLYSVEQISETWDTYCEVCSELSLHNKPEPVFDEWLKNNLPPPFLIHKDKEGYSKEEMIKVQLCPKCRGDGNLLRYNSPAILGTSMVPICDLCNGTKAIPMFPSPPLQKDKEEMTDEEISEKAKEICSYERQLAIVGKKEADSVWYFTMKGMKAYRDRLIKKN